MFMSKGNLHWRASHIIAPVEGTSIDQTPRDPKPRWHPAPDGAPDLRGSKPRGGAFSFSASVAARHALYLPRSMRKLVRCQ